MNETPISVIMSVYNASNYVKEAIESILNQSYKDFEFIIIDDASTDDSAKIIKSFNDDRIIFIHNETNQGLTKNLNRAITIAKGKYIARMDADDISLPQRLSAQKDYLDTHIDITCLGGGSIIIDRLGNKTGEKYPPDDHELLKFHMILKNQMIHSTVMVRKDILVNSNLYSEDYVFSQDYELWSRLIHMGYKIANLKEALIKYRFFSDSLTQNLNTKNTSYSYAKKIILFNISKYSSNTPAELEIITDILHRRNKIDSIKKLILYTFFFKQFGNNYRKLEMLSKKTCESIKKYIRSEIWFACKQYIKSWLNFIRGKKYIQ